MEFVLKKDLRGKGVNMTHAVRRLSLKSNQNESHCILIGGKSCVFRSITPGYVLWQSKQKQT